MLIRLYWNLISLLFIINKVIQNNRFIWVHNILDLEIFNYFQNILGCVWEICLSFEPMRDYWKIIVNASSHFLGGNRPNVSFAKTSQHLDLPFFAISGDTPEDWSSLTDGLLDLDSRPQNDLIGVVDLGNYFEQLLLLASQLFLQLIAERFILYFIRRCFSWRLEERFHLIEISSGVKFWLSCLLIKYLGGVKVDINKILCCWGRLAILLYEQAFRQQFLIFRIFKLSYQRSLRLLEWEILGTKSHLRYIKAWILISKTHWIIVREIVSLWSIAHHTITSLVMINLETSLRVYIVWHWQDSSDNMVAVTVESLRLLWGMHNFDDQWNRSVN